MKRSIAFVAVISVICAACDPSKDDSQPLQNPPSGVTCTSQKRVSDGGALTQALASATAGSCVVVQVSALQGSFRVPSGVSLVGTSGDRIVLTSATREPIITLEEGATLANLRIDGASKAGRGVQVIGASAKLTDVEIVNATETGLVISGKDGSGLVELTNVVVQKNGVGLVVASRAVKMTGGKITDNRGTGLSSGYGVVVANGASFDANDVAITNNEIVGLLVDGAQTKATLKGANVADNGGRGVWIQRTQGTIAAPAVTLENCKVERNKVVGVGSFEARGIIIVGGRVGDTQNAPVVTNIAITEQVGDGIGIFGGSNEISIQDTAVEANARAAGVVDGSEQGIIIVGGKVAAGPSGLKFVVQNSASTAIQIADVDRSTPSGLLGISASHLPIPSP